MPKRLLITTDAVGGVWQYTRDLVSCLLMDDYRVLVCVVGPSATDEQLEDLHSLGHRVTVEQHAGSLEWMSNPWRDVEESCNWLRRQERKFAPDLIHFNSFSYAAAGWDTPVMLAAHSCVGTWWQAVHGTYPGDEWNEYMRRVEAGIRSAQVVVTPSRSFAEDLRSTYRLQDVAIRVIHNSSSVAFDPAIKEPFCLAAGRFWDEAKNFRLLEQIACEVTWPVYLAGDTRDEPSCDNLRTLGKLNRSDLLSHLGRASIFLHPALYEPFGIAPLEAARLNCCLVLSNIPTLRELWDQSAFFLDPARVSLWVDAIEELAGSQSRRDTWAALAAARSGRYNLQAQADGYMRLYDYLLRSSGYTRRAVAV